VLASRRLLLLDERRVARRAPARPFTAFADALTLAARCLRMSRRQVDALLTALMLPVTLLFVYLFGGGSTPPPSTPVQAPRPARMPR
jgi:hypothetical protein